ncbi:MAG: hypothetical protein ACKVP3_23370 [Hyphomicrobiaceae bacterium]
MHGFRSLLILAMMVVAGGAAVASGGGGGGGGGDDNFVAKAFKPGTTSKPAKAKPKATKKAAPIAKVATPVAPVAAAASANGGIAECEKEFSRTLLSGCISDHLNKLAARLDERKSGPLSDAVTTLRSTASGLREAPSKEEALTVMEKAKTTLDSAVNALKSGPQVSQETADNLSAISGTLGYAIGAIQRKG